MARTSLPFFRRSPPAEDSSLFTVRYSARARRLRLRVDPRTRELVLTVPERVSRRKALAWADQHRDWAKQALAALPDRRPFRPGSNLMFEGEAHQLDWDPGRPRRVEFHPGRLVVGGPAEGLEGRVLRALKGEALKVLERETRALAAASGLSVTRVGIGDPRSRWGSCTSGGAIRYSWRLIMAPAFVRRATVAHEVAHLVHLDHGPEFHALVSRLLGDDPRPARNWLRREGAALHCFGS